jgi:hypothetical protein
MPRNIVSASRNSPDSKNAQFENLSAMLSIPFWIGVRCRTRVL